MERLLKGGVIGCGRMGAFTSEKVKKFAPEHYFPLSHTEAILAHNRIKMVGLNDVSKENLLKAGEYYGIKDLFIDFDNFLSIFTSRQRATIRKERKSIAKLGIEFKCKKYNEITDEDWNLFYVFYQKTYYERAQNPYLNKEFFL